MILNKTFSRNGCAVLAEVSQDKVTQDNKRRDHDNAQGGLWITQKPKSVASPDRSDLLGVSAPTL
jgi:hypothetical protein